VSFIRLAIAGPAIGIAVGLGLLILTRFLTRGTTLFFCYIIIGTYLTFILDERTSVRGSGFLGLVGLGLIW
jgi:hypothetical protein